ncbi:MAG: HD-GYP domain-containing protein, partial [Rubrobacteraceae bacterium]
MQLASEALGTVLDEEQLYKTVLVLTLELLEATGGIVFLETGSVVSLGLGGLGESVQALEQVEVPVRKPWIGRAGDLHALGVPVGRSGGSLFVVRKERPYTENEGVSLKLVARQLARAQERSRLYASLERTTLDAISALAAALESRDGTTGEHIFRAQTLTKEVAETLGLDPDTIQTTEYAAILHDVGKIGIPDAILNKPGKLDEHEWATMRLHPQMGVNILSKISGFERVSEVVLNHHERYDGQGYPLGTSGRRIPVEARIISVVDAY